jgi:hypothetical protein
MDYGRRLVVADFIGPNMDALAEVVLKRLQAEGIDAVRLADDHAIEPVAHPMATSVRIAVPNEQAEQAMVLLGETENDELR